VDDQHQNKYRTRDQDTKKMINQNDDQINESEEINMTTKINMFDEI
jgi:hypothetical protein